MGTDTKFVPSNCRHDGSKGAHQLKGWSLPRLMGSYLSELCATAGLRAAAPPAAVSFQCIWYSGSLQYQMLCGVDWPKALPR